jgi:hypothetical protein
LVSGCQFLGDDLAYYAINDSPGQDVAVTAVGCQFGRVGQGNGYLYAIRRITAGSKDWTFVGCEFNDINSSGNCAAVNAAAKMTFQDCVFQPGSGVYSALASAGTLVLNDCCFKSSRGVYVEGADGNAILELNRNRWDVSALTQINSPGSNTIKIRGSDNQFYEGTPGVGEGFFIVGSSGLSNLTGDIQCRRGVGVYSFASNVLTVNLGHDTYEVDESGTPAINTINMAGSAGGGSSASDLNRFHNARVTLRAKQAFSLGSSGNIVAAGGARAVDSIVTLQYFPVDAKWYDV